MSLKEKYLISDDLKNRLLYCFHKYRIPTEFEDFEADYRLYILEGKGAHQTVEQFTIDYLRNHFGRKGQKRSLLEAGELVVDDHNATRIDDTIDFDAMVKSLPALDRIMLILIMKYNFSQAEVADVFGHTPAWVSVKLPKVLGSMLPPGIN